MWLDHLGPFFEGAEHTLNLTKRFDHENKTSINNLQGRMGLQGKKKTTYEVGILKSLQSQQTTAILPHFNGIHT